MGVAASTGWFGGMRLAFALKARLGLRLLVPIGTLFKGYAPTAWLGLGENLPAQVGRQWGQWCAAGGYATNAVRAGLADRLPRAGAHAHRRAACRGRRHRDPRDGARPAANAARFAARDAARQPADHGLRGIGHLDWFRQSHQALWPLLRRAVLGDIALEAPDEGRHGSRSPAVRNLE